MTTRSFRKALHTVGFTIAAISTGCATAPAPLSKEVPVARPSIAERRQCVAAAYDTCAAESRDERALEECLAARVSACESGGRWVAALTARP